MTAARYRGLEQGRLVPTIPELAAICEIANASVAFQILGIGPPRPGQPWRGRVSDLSVDARPRARVRCQPLRSGQTRALARALHRRLPGAGVEAALLTDLG